MANMLRNRSGAVLLGIAALAVFIILNLGASALTGVRVDLTQDKLFTLSDGTKNILKSMNKPATVTLYYSREVGEAAPVSYKLGASNREGECLSKILDYSHNL